jgi:hypothetical protein
MCWWGVFGWSANSTLASVDDAFACLIGYYWYSMVSTSLGTISDQGGVMCFVVLCCVSWSVLTSWVRIKFCKAQHVVPLATYVVFCSMLFACAQLAFVCDARAVYRCTRKQFFEFYTSGAHSELELSNESLPPIFPQLWCEQYNVHEIYPSLFLIYPKFSYPYVYKSSVAPLP